MKSPKLPLKIGRALTCCILGGLLMSACARSPKTSFYTLSTIQPTAELCPPDGPKRQIRLVLLHFPALLDRPQIATRSQPNLVEYAEFHRWAGSLQDDFLQTLEGNLRQRCTRLQVLPDFWPGASKANQLDLNLRRFDGSLNGEVHLSIDWMIRGEQTNMAWVERHSEIIEPVREASYTGLVAAQSRAITTLAVEILHVLVNPE